LLLSLYAFRREYFLAYGRFVMFMAYYMQFAVTVKIFWTLLTVVPEVQMWFGRHQKSSVVRVCLLVFGVDDGAVDKAKCVVSKT
jgi:hypothetical protein